MALAGRKKGRTEDQQAKWCRNHWSIIKCLLKQDVTSETELSDCVGMKRDHINHHLKELRKEGIAKKVLDKWCLTDELKERVLASQKGGRAGEAYLGRERTEEQTLKDRIAEDPKFFIVEKEGEFRLKNRDEQLHEIREVAHSRRDAQMDKGFMRRGLVGGAFDFKELKKDAGDRKGKGEV